MRIALVAVTAMLAAGVFWNAGEQHRSNCLVAGKTGCSVLPWEAGAKPSLKPRVKLTLEACLRLRVQKKVQAASGEGMDPLPPECVNS